MGPRVMRRLPKYVHGFIDRHGKARFYFRRAGFKKIALPGLPWSPEFMAAYETALAGQPLQVGGARTKPGTIRALAVSYYNSVGFRSCKPSTQTKYRRIIDRLCREHGDKRAATLQREHVVKLMAARAEKPEGANSLRKVLRAMMQHAMETGLRADDPTRDVRAIRVKSDGFHSWTTRKFLNSRNGTRSARGRVWRLRFCCTPGNGAPTLCEWAGNISGTASSACGRTRPGRCLSYR
jgi:hypothetical protein